MNESAQVLILGAGPVGLAAALELARFGVRSAVYEKHSGISTHPKTRNFNTRTMEIAAGWGPATYRRFRGIDTPPGWKSPIRFMASATGEEFGRIESKGFEGPGPDISPAEPVMSSQELIEQILLDVALATGLVDVHFNVEAKRLVSGGEAGDQQAVLELQDNATGEVTQVAGAALVAADGAFSLIREELGLELEGKKELSHLVNCYFRADIEPYLGDRIGVLFFISNDQARGVLQPLDANGRWLCQINVQANDWSREAFPDTRAQDWIRAASGIPDLDVDVLSIGFWKLNATVVDQFVVGRVVMCGDAAHQFPPTGGLGVNTGLQGMHNAMWKLAYCIQGKAGWPLLHTYHEERRPVSKLITAQSLQNSYNVGRINNAMVSGGETGLTPEVLVQETRRYGNHLGVEFGAFYESEAIVSDGAPLPLAPDSYADYLPSAVPGARAPHVWLGIGDEQFSTLDLIGTQLTLLAGPDADVWLAEVENLRVNVGLPVAGSRIGGPGIGNVARFLELYDLDATGAVLIRPDGHIAWRARSDSQPTSALRHAVMRILALG